MQPFGHSKTLRYDDWHYQLQYSIRNLDSLQEWLKQIPNLSFEISENLRLAVNEYQLKITPYVLDNFKRCVEKFGIRRAYPLLAIFLPNEAEVMYPESEFNDGIGEESYKVHPTPLITSIYGNRALFTPTFMCASYCRFCTRRRKIGDRAGVLKWELIEKSLQYFQNHSEINEVIISGGDPLVFSDSILDKILSKLRAIEHIKVLRINTKIPTVLPQRITDDLVITLKKYHPLYVVIHFTHPLEISEEVKEACRKLADGGLPLASHTPLLAGINDSLETIKELMETLITIRVRPYYLVQYIPNRWNQHFKLKLQKGIDIMRGLHGWVSGLANPTFIVYLPNSKGKVPILPRYFKGFTELGELIFENFEGNIEKYSELIPELRGSHKENFIYRSVLS